MGLTGCLFVCLLILLLMCFLFKNSTVKYKIINQNKYAANFTNACIHLLVTSHHKRHHADKAYFKNT